MVTMFYAWFDGVMGMEIMLMRYAVCVLAYFAACFLLPILLFTAGLVVTALNENDADKKLMQNSLHQFLSLTFCSGSADCCSGSGSDSGYYSDCCSAGFCSGSGSGFCSDCSDTDP